MQGGGRFGGFGGSVRNAGMNPPNGVVINYYLKNVSDSTKLSVDILAGNRKLIKSFSTTSKENKIEMDPGMNQFVWDMNHPPAEKADGLILWNGSVGGPKAAPGEYIAKFRSGSDSAEVRFTILSDPNYKTTAGEYEEQVDFLLTVRDKFSEIMKALRNIKDVRQQMADFSARNGRDLPREIKQQIDTINKQLTGVEEALHQTKAKSGQDVLNYPIRLDDKLAGLYRAAAVGNAAPSKQAREAYAELSGQIDVQLAKLKNVMTAELGKLNAMIHEKALPVIGLKKE